MPNTREKLIELIKTAKSKKQYDFLFGNIDDAIDMKSDEEYIADHLIANGVTISNLETVDKEWISIKDRKPTKDDADKYGRVLVMEFGMISLVNYRGPINSPERFQHWMPLPEPPKEV